MDDNNYYVFPLFRGELDFSACMDLKNPWNENKPVKISRDGQVQFHYLRYTCTCAYNYYDSDIVLSNADACAVLSSGISWSFKVVFIVGTADNECCACVYYRITGKFGEYYIWRMSRLNVLAIFNLAFRAWLRVTGTGHSPCK